MEKLIELLNEWYFERYGTNPNFVRFEDYGGNDYGYFCSPDDAKLMVESEVWTKKYGFIKRLVDNDKINIDKIENSEYYLIDWFYYNERKKFGIEWLDDVEKILLMFLAISDNPIEDLISYLK